MDQFVSFITKPEGIATAGAVVGSIYNTVTGRKTKARLADLDTRFKNLQDAYDRLDKDHGRIEHVLDEVQQERDAAQRRCSTLEARLLIMRRATRKRVNMYKSEIARLHLRITELEALIVDLRKKLAACDAAQSHK